MSKLKIFTCKCCNKDFSTTSKKAANYCSERCWAKAQSDKRFIGKKYGYDYIECPVCNQKTRQISQRHAEMHGFNSAAELGNHYNVPITCEEKKEKNKRENNPAFGHGGKYSKWSKNFKHGYDPTAHEKFAQEHSKRRKDPEQKHKYISNIEYWIKQCDGDIEKAQTAYTKFQTRDLSFFIEKYGEEEGTKRYKQKTERWAKSFKKCNFSKISQELFDSISTNLNDKSNIYYATFERDDMAEYQNKEFYLRIENTVLRPDFIDLSKKKIIEFDGDYWHSESRANPAREKYRDDIIKNNGYQILHVAEHNYRKNKEEVIKQCLDFLTE